MAAFEGSTYSDGHCVWRAEDLWEAAKGVPTIELPVDDFVGQLNGTCWTQGDEEVTPNWVLCHTRRILNAEDYPIIIDQDGIVLDGVHRLCRAVLEGREVIATQRLTVLPEPIYIVEAEQVPLFI